MGGSELSPAEWRGVYLEVRSVEVAILVSELGAASPCLHLSRCSLQVPIG